ncbi:MAG: MspA family porin [Gordonia sp. (in: high G+C Gram-positive bacteria)]
MVLLGVTAALVAGVAIVGEAGPVSAAPMRFKDRQVTKVSADGWKVTAVKSGEQLSVVHPLDNASTSKEGFLSLRGAGEISGAGTSPVLSGTVTTGFQISCGGRLDSGTVGISAGPTAQFSASWPPAAVIGAQAMGNISANLRPGSIETVVLGSRPMAGKRAGISVNGVEIRVSGCISTVAIRSYTTVAIQTGEEDTTVNVYGKAHVL